MEGLTALVIIAIVIGYLNLWLIIKKEKPNIIINNHIPETKVEIKESGEVTKFKLDASGTAEIPIQSTVTVKDIKGDISLDSEKVGTASVKNITEKIKKFRNSHE